MPKSTEQLAASKAGSTAESNGFGSAERPQRPGGLYRLYDRDRNVVDEQIVITHPLFGDSQAAAFERVGYEYIREAKPGEVKQLEIMPNAGLSGNTSEDLKGLQARMSKFEDETKAKDDEIASLRAQLAQRDGDDSTVQSENNDQVKADQASETKKEAATRVEARQGDEEGKTEETDKVAELKAKADEKAAANGQAAGTTTTPANTNDNTKKEGK